MGRGRLGVDQTEPLAAQEAERGYELLQLADSFAQVSRRGVGCRVTDGARQVALTLLASAVVILVGVKGEIGSVPALEQSAGGADKSFALSERVGLELGERERESSVDGGVERLGHSIRCV